MNITVNELTLEFSELDPSDSATLDSFAITVTVSAPGFAGVASGWPGLQRINAFIDALDALDQNLKGRADFVCGGVLEEQIRIEISPFGQSG